MSRQNRKHNAYYQYMEPFFEKGNDAEIQLAKKQYRKQYKAKWRKEHRKKNSEVTTNWNNEEYSVLKTEAKKHKLSITRFIKVSSLGYINNRYIPLHREEINKILQLIGLAYNQIVEMAEEEKIKQQTEKELTEKISQFEHEIRIQLFSPKTIWHIIKEALTETPQLKDNLITYIQTSEG